MNSRREESLWFLKTPFINDLSEAINVFVPLARRLTALFIGFEYISLFFFLCWTTLFAFVYREFVYLYRGINFDNNSSFYLWEIGLSHFQIEKSWARTKTLSASILKWDSGSYSWTLEVINIWKEKKTKLCVCVCRYNSSKCRP